MITILLYLGIGFIVFVGLIVYLKKNILIFILIGFMTIVGVIFYIHDDVTSLYKQKHLLENKKYLIVDYNNQSFSIHSDIIKKVLFNKNNVWVLSVASYAHVDEMYISSNDNFHMNTHGNRIIINYKTIRYGWIQIISKNEFPKFKKEIFSMSQKLIPS